MRTGDRVTINAQLIDALGRTVAGETYERAATDVAALQNDVVSAIAQAIHLRFAPRIVSASPAAPLSVLRHTSCISAACTS